MTVVLNYQIYTKRKQGKRAELNAAVNFIFSFGNALIQQKLMKLMEVSFVPQSLRMIIRL